MRISWLAIALCVGVAAKKKVLMVIDVQVGRRLNILFNFAKL